METPSIGKRGGIVLRLLLLIPGSLGFGLRSRDLNPKP